MVGTVAADQLEGGLVAVEDDDHRRGQGLERLDADVSSPSSQWPAPSSWVPSILAITS
jgi:hypothetical protein